MTIALLYRMVALTIGISISPLAGASASVPESSGAYGPHRSGSADTTMASTPNAACPTDARGIHRGTLPDAFLHEPPAVESGPYVVIDHYNLSEGLRVAYQANTGKRILFRARFRADGSVQAEVAHWNAQSGHIEKFLGTITRQSGRAGRFKRSMQLAGVDLSEYILGGVGEHASRKPSHDRIVTFLDSDAGQALFEAIPAMYAALEPLEDNRKLAALQTPFGMVLTALQLKTGRYGGFGVAERILGPAEANRLQANCRYDNCQFRGVNFTVHRSGLFDVVSKPKLDGDPARSSCARGKSQVGSTIRRLFMQKDGENQDCINRGDCFGYCGPGCFNPGEIWTPECFGHDLCVCRFSHEQCALSVPEVPSGTDDCTGCTDLFSAIASWWWSLFEEDEVPEEEGW